jgi:hypothetical protein
MEMSQRILEPYIREKRVTLYDARVLFPKTLKQSHSSRQRPFYDLVLKQLHALQDLNPYVWMTCLDSDEFLVPKAHGTLPKFLEHFDAEVITGIMLNGRLFGYGDSDAIPIFTPPSIIESCTAVLSNGRAIKSIGSVKHTAFWHAHHPMGDKMCVSPEGMATDFENPVASYDIAYYAHYIQPSLEALNAKWQNANYPFSEDNDNQRSRRDIAMNRFTNNKWINFPNEDKFDPTITSTDVCDLFNRQKLCELRKKQQDESHNKQEFVQETEVNNDA